MKIFSKARALILAMSLGAGSFCSGQVSHTITSPGFFYSVDGAGNNPSFAFDVGTTNHLTINTTPGIFGHPVVISTNTLASGLYSGATGGNISSGVITVSVATNGFPIKLYYVCRIHGFFGTIFVNTPVPPPADILSLKVGTNVVMRSLGPFSTWQFIPEFSSNLTTGAWAPVPGATNVFVNGTNTTTFNRLEPICGPNVFLRVRQQKN